MQKAKRRHKMLLSIGGGVVKPSVEIARISESVPLCVQLRASMCSSTYIHCDNNAD